MRGKLLGSVMAMALAMPMAAGAMIAYDNHGKDSKEASEEKVKPVKVSIIHAGTLLAVPGSDPMMEKSVIVSDGKIVAVKDGYVDTADIDNEDVTILDMKDKFVMPGLMDMHVHFMSQRGVSVDGDYDRAYMMTKNARATLMAGYTTVRDLGSSGKPLFDLKDRIESDDIAGPRIHASGVTFGVGSGRAEGKDCNGVDNCRRMARDNFREGANWFKIYSSCSGFQIICSQADGAPVFFEDEVEAIMGVAAKYKVKVATHSHPTASGNFMLNYDIKSIEHGTFLDRKALRKMKSKGVYFIPTVAVQDMLAGMQKSERTSEAIKEHNEHFIETHPKTVKMAYEMGVPMATGSDAGVVPHGKNYREIEIMVEWGIDIKDALKMATVNAADLLDVTDELGTVEEGKLADIIAIDGNPLEEVKDIRNVSFVMKGGKVYKD